MTSGIKEQTDFTIQTLKHNHRAMHSVFHQTTTNLDYCTQQKHQVYLEKK